MTRRLIPLALAGAVATGLLLGQGPGPFAGAHQRRLEFIASYLGLTQAQQDNAKATFESARAAAQPLMTELRAARQALEDAVKAGKVDEIQALSAKIGTLTGQLIATHAQAMSKFYASLTPEQQAKADKLHDFVGPGFGPMHRGRFTR